MLNGDIYVGDFFNGLFEGNGILYLNNQDKYIGEFKNNFKNGKG